MTVSGPRVRDFTDVSSPSLNVEVAHGAAFELLLSLFVFSSLEGHDVEAYDLPPDWVATQRASLGDELAAEVQRLGGSSGELWLSLLSIAAEAPEPTIEALLELMESMDARDVRFRATCLACHGDDAGTETLVAAADGDVQAIETLREKGVSKAVLGFLNQGPEESVNAVLATLKGFADRAYDDGTAGILARDAEHKRSLARTLEPERLVEVATNGITFEPRADVDRVLLVPSVVLRPWVTITENGGDRVIAYPVSDRNLGADPDAPPTWLIDVYKALGDERRLAILAVLGAGKATLAEITDSVGLAKSTVHHHLRILRRAGLIRIIVGDEKLHELRRDTPLEAYRALAGFLGINEQETK